MGSSTFFYLLSTYEPEQQQQITFIFYTLLRSCSYSSTHHLELRTCFGVENTLLLIGSSSAQALILLILFCTNKINFYSILNGDKDVRHGKQPLRRGPFIIDDTKFIFKNVVFA